MSSSFLVLCLSAFASVAIASSIAVVFLLPVFDRLILLLSPRLKPWFWLTLLLFPAMAGVTALGVSLTPALGLGMDHCLEHGLHHQHLCPVHVAGPPGIILIVGASLVVFRGIYLLFSMVLNQWKSVQTARLLREGGELEGEFLVFESKQPQAFVLGLLRPQVFVSRSLLSLSSTLIEPVVAHERAHVARRDLSWRALAPLIAFGHLPSIASQLLGRLGAAQEMAADEFATGADPHARVRMAEALVALARKVEAPPVALAFSHGDLNERVKLLLDGQTTRSHWALSLTVGLFLSVLIALGVGQEWVHHGLETFLDALS